MCIKGRACTKCRLKERRRKREGEKKEEKRKKKKGKWVGGREVKCDRL